jgi:hypothetical protein
MLNNPSQYDLKFAGIAFKKDKRDKYLLVTFREDEESTRKQYKSIKSAKIAFARLFNSDPLKKKVKPDWGQDILHYSYRENKEKNGG